MQKNLQFEIARLRALTTNFPGLGWEFALEFDDTYKRHTGQASNVSFSKNSQVIGLRSNEKNSRNSALAASEKSRTAREFSSRIFDLVTGMETAIINIAYANQLKHEPHLWRYFINKYFLSRSGWPLYTSAATGENIFDSFSKNPAIGALQKVTANPLVSVIMPTYNNSDTIEYAARSILEQTYTHIELIIVDDCSTDHTAARCLSIAASDDRVNYIRNKHNVGAYASRNIALNEARGDYVTVLDGDDWSFPERISYQIARIQNTPCAVAHLGSYIRMTPAGEVTSFRQCGAYSLDGVLHKCLATLLINKDYLSSQLGYWDTVRFGADAELYNRLKILNPGGLIDDQIPLLIALDRQTSLTNLGQAKLGGTLRHDYAIAFTRWHELAHPRELRVTFPQTKRPFPCPSEMLIPAQTIHAAELNPSSASTHGVKYDQWSYKLYKHECNQNKYLIENGIHHLEINTSAGVDILLDGMERAKPRGSFLAVFTGAIPEREKKDPPFFSGLNIASQLDVPLLAISDPALTLSRELGLAWYVGHDKLPNLPDRLAEILDNFAHFHDLKPILLGGSGGGFAALNIQSKMRTRSRSLVFNPQTAIESYYKKHATNLINHAFPLHAQQISGDYSENSQEAILAALQSASILHNINSHVLPEGSTSIYLQNVDDPHHFENHYSKFTSIGQWEVLSPGVSTCRERGVTTVLATWGRGHAPLPTQLVIMSIRSIIAGLDNLSIANLLQEKINNNGGRHDN